ncbi:alpha/beta fold hydrolase BchO [Acidiphilium sp. PA]|uniref:alpha/beta fold hydrolase BchO n=1 Tax=Acidiphilium sp. PA TaxID=2871705 RepID=UPI002ADE90FB|nr:alpha/beta fold hydrolase BchO [Acidiphilium sp. PA]
MAIEMSEPAMTIEETSLWQALLGDGAPNWQRDGTNWPNRAASRFIEAGGLRFHVQIMGKGPVALLLHGTGAATHSWRDLAPALAANFTVVAPDLPGHGFTETPVWPRMSLPGMAGAVASLLGVLDIAPAIIIGHSAGAAIGIDLCGGGTVAPSGLVSLNGALLPYRGNVTRVFSPIAKMFAMNPLVPRLFAWRAKNPTIVRRLLASTGSTIDAAGEAHYATLVRRSGHAAAALTMMANWDLDPIEASLPDLASRLLLVTGANDRSIPPREAERIARIVPGARLVSMPGLGHLAHEEAPAETAAIIADFAREIGVIGT